MKRMITEHDQVDDSSLAERRAGRDDLVGGKDGGPLASQVDGKRKGRTEEGNVFRVIALVVAAPAVDFKMSDPPSPRSASRGVVLPYGGPF
jgi:hypothetical protein